MCTAAAFWKEGYAKKAKSKHIQRLPEKEELNTLVYANSDGTETMYMFDTNVKYIDKDGKVKDKTTNIYSSVKGFENRENDVKVSFSTKLTDAKDRSHYNIHEYTFMK